MFTGNGHASRLGSMFKLSVAALRRNEEPTVFPQLVQNLTNFHEASIAQSLEESKLS